MTSQAEAGALPFAGNDLVYLVPPARARTDGTDSDSEQPQIVLILGWMGAELNHLKRISATHSKMYPAAMQFIVLSDSESTVGSKAYNLKRIRPVADFIREHAFGGLDHPSILFHVFSGGGTSQLIWLSQIFNTILPKAELGLARPTAVVILDSTPGAFHHHQYILGNTLALPSGPRRTLVALRSSARWAVMSAWWALSGSQSTHSFIRDGLNNPGLLAWINDDALRVYIYSDEDEVADMNEVASHAADARRKGLRVQEELFSRSGHVRHAAKDPKRYWAIVNGAWRDARAKL
ncbi:hypothetical protein C8F01DRAFT_1169358 [Mycena amicta]|nr:hypothetical protein C8F01DRAFT_1169358 [Mycena amicta]